MAVFRSFVASSAVGCHDGDDLEDDSDDDGDDNNGSRYSDQMLSRHLLYVVAAKARVVGAGAGEDRRLKSPGGCCRFEPRSLDFVEVVKKFDSHRPVTTSLWLVIGGWWVGEGADNGDL